VGKFLILTTLQTTRRCVWIKMSIYTVKAKFHYAIWLATSFEPDSVMEFGF